MEKDREAEKNVEKEHQSEIEIWRDRVSVAWKMLIKYLLNYELVNKQTCVCVCVCRYLGRCGIWVER